jgi:hypothetical protein
MTQKNMIRARQNAKRILSDFKKGGRIIVADVKVNIKKAKADVANALDHERADETANVAKRNADTMPRGLRQKAAYIKADFNASIAKAKANRRHNQAYANADSERSTTRNNRRTA